LTTQARWERYRESEREREMWEGEGERERVAILRRSIRRLHFPRDIREIAGLFWTT